MNAVIPISIVLAEDDPDDRMMTREALRESRLVNELHCVGDGEELIEFLTSTGRYAGKRKPNPGIILLDLNMPKKNGYEVITELKANKELKNIPIVVLTTSKSEEDIVKSYDMGVNSFISKPVSFDGLVKVMRVIGRYWFGIVELPKIKQ